MGTKMAPTCATLVMGYLEANLYRKYEETFGKNEPEKFIKTFKRFLDDCFVFWKRSIEELHKFHNMINNLHEKIEFTMEKHESKIPLLDVLAQASQQIVRVAHVTSLHTLLYKYPKAGNSFTT